MKKCEGWRLGYRPALDGLRGIAVLLVMAAHAEIPGFRYGGGTGVTMFFVLSGFLITSLLVEEQRETGRVNLRGFYRRRAVRLLPALLIFVAAIAAIGQATIGDASAAVFYVANWVRASGNSIGSLGHTWSLAVEEQFYMIWPALFVLLARRPRVLLVLALAGAAVSIVERIVLWSGPETTPRVYFASDTRADAILLGCALGLVVAGGTRLRIPRVAVVSAEVMLVAVTGLFDSNPFFYRWGLTLASIGSVVLVARVAIRPAGVAFVLERAAFIRTGRLSYGLYLWHVPIMGWASTRLPFGPERVLLTFGVSFLLAIASFECVEKPLLRFKTRQRPKVEMPAEISLRSAA